MKNTLRLRISIAAVVIAVLAMLVGAMLAFVPHGAKADEARTATLTYSDSTHTVVTGVSEEFDKTSEYTVTVPATVTEIELAAFAGQKNLVGVTFETGSALKKIGDFAFGNTGIGKLTLPNGLEEIGASAFAQTNIKSVKLPKSVTKIGQRAFGNIDNTLTVSVTNTAAVFGTAAFDAGSYIVAENRAAYEALKANAAFKKYESELTYPVTIEYNLLGSVIAKETRLYGKGYEVELVDGVWAENENPTLGTAVTNGMVWYAATEGSGDTLAGVGDALDADAVTALLASEEFSGEKLTLYAVSKGDGKVFFARDNIVYNGTQYALNNLRDLLTPISDPITSATIESYVNANGEAPETLPTTVGNAGHYVIKVTDGGTDYTFEMDIARRTVDIGVASNLSWRLTQVAGTSTAAELLNASGITLYIYDKNDGTGKYPSRSVLSDAEKTALDLSDGYTTRLVRQSVVRYRNTTVVVGIAGGLAGDAYSVTSYDSGNGKTSSAYEVGVYTAGATIEASDNYTLVLNGAPTDDIARGITISVADDGRTAYITKNWYIVTEGNKLVDENGEDYAIADRVYGDTTAIAMPKLLHGDVQPQDYGSAGDPITLTLIYNDKSIGNRIIGDETFSRRELVRYINDSMPAGEYRLRVRAQDVTTTEFDEENDPGHEYPNYIAHAGFDDVIVFTVAKRDVNPEMTKSIDRELKDRTFTYEYSGAAHLYDADAAELIADVLGKYDATVGRFNTVWNNSEYDGLFGGYEIKFNLARMYSDTYYTADSMPEKAIKPDKYTVYYNISAPNHNDSSASGEGDRTDYKFYVVNIMAVSVPVLLDKTYTGEPLTADITENIIFEVAKNDGGVNVGEYEVVLRFRQPDYYMWEGQTIYEKTAEISVMFSVHAANNHWATEPGVTFWVEGNYDHTENAVFGSALFGTPIIVISDSEDNIVYNSAAGINKLDTLAAGTYRLSASVAATNNYDALTYSVFITVFEKPGLPWWGIMLIAIGALLLAAIIILILWKKGVFTILTEKLSLAIRTKATTDAVIAAVRASKVAEASKASRAEAEARDKAQERVAARKAAAQAEREKSTDERVAELEAKAQSESERADKIKARADAFRARADKIKSKAENEQKAEEQTAEAAENAEDAAKPTEE